MRTKKIFHDEKNFFFSSSSFTHCSLTLCLWTKILLVYVLQVVLTFWKIGGDINFAACFLAWRVSERARRKARRRWNEQKKTICKCWWYHCWCCYAVRMYSMFITFHICIFWISSISPSRWKLFNKCSPK